MEHQNKKKKKENKILTTVYRQTRSQLEFCPAQCESLQWEPDSVKLQYKLCSRWKKFFWQEFCAVTVFLRIFAVRAAVCLRWSGKCSVRYGKQRNNLLICVSLIQLWYEIWCYFLLFLFIYFGFFERGGGVVVGTGDTFAQEITTS